jgi:transcription elongation factor Elf1
MQRRFNVTVLLACPHCLAEIMTTCDEVQEEQTILCCECGTKVELKPEERILPGAFYAPPEQSYSGIGLGA